jgi:hypothetical protein
MSRFIINYLIGIVLIALVIQPYLLMGYMTDFSFNPVGLWFCGTVVEATVVALLSVPYMLGKSLRE